MIIDFNKNNGGGSADLTKYWTSAQTVDYVDEAISDISGITVDLSDYYTSAQTEEAIANATEDYITSADTKGFYNNIADKAETIDGVLYKKLRFETPDGLNIYKDVYVSTINGKPIIKTGHLAINPNIELPTSADVKTQIESYNYITSAYTGYASASDFNTLSGIVQTNDVVVSTALNDLDERVNELSGRTVDLSAYWTSAETESAITVALGNIDLSNYYTSAQTENAIISKGYITSADTQLIENHIDDVERVTSIALNELNDKIEILSGSSVDLSNYVTSGQVETQITSKNYVDSTDIRHIVKISQSDYDTLVSGGTVDSYTWYLITGTTN